MCGFTSRARERSRQAARLKYNSGRCAVRLCSSCFSAGSTFFAGLGRPAIGDSDEAFYAEAGREMVESGDWLTPHYNYEVRFQKPILFYWLVAARMPRRVSARPPRARSRRCRPRPRLVTRPSGAAGTTSRRRALPAHRRDRLRLLLDRPPGAARPAARLLHHAVDLGRAARRASTTSSAPGAVVARSPARRRARLSDEGTGGPRPAGARRRCRSSGSSAVARACRPAGCAGVVPSRPLDCRAVVRGDDRWCTARRTSAASSSATTSSGSRRPASTIRARSGSTCRSWPAACCRGRRLPSAVSRRLATLAARKPRALTETGRLLIWAAAAGVLHAVDRQAAALHPADPAAARRCCSRARIHRASDDRRRGRIRESLPLMVALLLAVLGRCSIARARCRVGRAVAGAGERRRHPRRRRRPRWSRRSAVRLTAVPLAVGIAGAITLGRAAVRARTGRPRARAAMAALVLTDRTASGAGCDIPGVRAEPGLLHGHRADRPVDRSAAPCLHALGRSRCCA